MQSRLVKAAFGVALALALAAPVRAATMPDAWITTKVKISLLTSEGVSTRHVNVDTMDGRVTLHGNVSTAAEKTKAEELAKQVSGVRDVRNLLQVVPERMRKVTSVSDDRIKEGVENALKSDPAMESAKIEVQSVNAGVVLLAGDARSMSEAYRAIYDASNVEGVRRVASEIKSPGMLEDREVWRDGQYDESAYQHSAARDAWITSDAKMRLLANADTPAFAINVDTENGVVTLFGMVDSAQAKQQAESEVHKVGGVSRVINDLQVVPKTEQTAVKQSDDQLAKSIEDRFKTREALGDVNVEVHDGVARLTGSVKTHADHLSALTVARSTDGVRRVIDDIKLSGPEVSSR